MKNRGIRITLVVVEAFIGVGAVGGGIAILAGAMNQWLPITFLQGTPFSDYTIPGLVLLLIVGGGMLLAAAAQFMEYEWAVLVSMAMGCIMVGWEAFEVAIIDRYAQAIILSTIVQQVLFTVLGLMILALAVSLWMKEYRRRKEAIL
jgi:ABC-type polysaccharide transport system permease subunit